MSAAHLAAAAAVAGLLAASAPAAVAAELPVSHSVRQLTVPGTAQGEPRKVDVQLWYPAAEVTGRPKTVYRSALYGHSLGTDAWSPLSWQVEAEIAREGAPIDPAGKPFPVIVFSH